MTELVRYGAHPFADIFPLIEGDELAALTADIGEHGLREKIVLHEEMILDGRNRFKALTALGQVNDKHFRALTKADGDPLIYVLSKNLHRRHLNESQRAMVAARIANLEGKGRPKGNAQIQAIPQGAAAKTLNVGRSSVQSAKTVLTKADPSIVKAVDSGKLPVSEGAKAAKFDAETQRDIAAKAEAGEDHAVRKTVKAKVRAEKETKLAGKILALPDEKFGVLYVDPEWQFEFWSDAGKNKSSADNHYTTTPTVEIMARDVASIAADDSVLLLWATVPMLPDALAVMKAWGFEYKSNIVWDKVTPGSGFWFINQHELLLLGTRGDVPAPAAGDQWRSVQAEKKRAHSEKPDFAYALIEAYFPTLPKVELNARKARDGWSRWGSNSPAPEAETKVA